MEQVIDQGQLDYRKGRFVVPGNTATIGGVRGEVESWLPILEIDKLYRLGQLSEKILVMRLITVRNYAQSPRTLRVRLD